MHSQLHGQETEDQQQKEEEADQIGRLSPLTSPLAPTPPASRKSLILGTNNQPFGFEHFSALMLAYDPMMSPVFATSLLA